MPATLVKVAVLHRNRLFGESLTSALSHEDGLNVVACIPEPDDPWPYLAETDADVVIMQLGSSHTSPTGYVPSRVLRTRILMVGPSEDDSDIQRAISAGATAYLPSSVSLRMAFDSVRALAAGEAVTSPKVVGLLFARLARDAKGRNQSSTASAHLTRREREIVQLIRDGLANKEIAVRLGIEVQTVKNHVHNILDKLQQKGRRAAAEYAVERGLVAPFA